jgi:hypothetical protein
VRRDEVTQAISSSSRGNWTVIGNDDSRFPARTAEGKHLHAAVYNPDPDILLAWGLVLSEGVREADWVFSSPEIMRQRAEAWCRDKRVAQWSVLLVDGDRCYLPELSPATPEGEGPAATRWTYQKEERELAILLRDLSGLRFPGVDEYLHRAHARAASG